MRPESSSARNLDSAACRDPGLTRALDELLFEPDQWFAITARNRKVPGVTPGTLDQALALVGRGQVATIVGRLRPEVVGVDVDADDALGDLAVQLVRDWCATRGLWHLQRPSGGGPGHWHLLVVPGIHRHALDHEISRLRSELRLGQSLDPRPTRHLRPLSAPHRTGRAAAAPTAPDGLESALSALQAVLEPLPDRVLARRQRHGASERRREPRGAARGPAEPLTPLPRPRRPLPAVWAAYLEDGRRAAVTVDRDPTTRSQLELEATTQLVIAGYSRAQAWAAITGAHPTAFTKARCNGQRWWLNVWNRAVIDADDWLRTRRAAAAAEATSQPVATTAARAALDALWRTWPPRTRHTDQEVLTAVLDRMDRAGIPAVPVPQRDLVLDCAIASRTTVRAALNRLQAVGLLVVEATYVPGTTDTSHTLRLPERLPAPGLVQLDQHHSQHASGGVSLIGPPRFQPPHRRPPLPLRRALGLPATALLAHLPGHSTAQGCTLAQLAHAAGLLEHDQETPTPRQLRTTRAHLRTLATHGLAEVDEHGHWRASTTASPPNAAATDAPSTPQASVGRLIELGHDLDARIRQRVDDERAEFRACVDPAARRARWEQQRHAALARAAKAARARQKAWWDAHPPAAAAQRRTALATAFAALPVPHRAARKQHLAQQRARAGENERARYDTWLTGLTLTDLDQRSVQRARAFARLPQLEQQQLVAAWTDHRARWQLPHAHRRTAAPTPRHTAEERLLHRQPPTVEELVDQLTLLDARTGSAPAAAAG